jgi:uncharacterized protein YktA (UPF0223 family)
MELSEKNKKIPEILYKYMSFEVSKKVLINNQLRVTPANQFNDPFDMLPGELVGEKPIITKDGITSRDYDVGEEFYFEIRDNYSELFGVTCFSKFRENILMWSHYADSHKGIVIGFDSKKLWNNLEDYFKVIYQRKRVLTPYDIAVGKANYEKQYKHYKKLIRSKFEEWNYEKEYRLINKFENCKYDGINDLYFFNFKDSTINEIILGAEMDITAKNNIRNIIKDKKLKVDIKEAKIDTKEYKLII